MKIRCLSLLFICFLFPFVSFAAPLSPGFIVNEDFEGATLNVKKQGAPVLVHSTEEFHLGKQSLKVTMEAEFTGPSVDILDFLKEGKEYSISFWAKAPKDGGEMTIKGKAAEASSGGTDYNIAFGNTQIYPDRWTEVKGSYVPTKSIDSFSKVFFYIESIAGFAGKTYFVDDLKIFEAGAIEEAPAQSAKKPKNKVFPDVIGTECEEAVSTLLGLNIINTNDTRFEPETVLTRAEFIAMAAGLTGFNNTDGTYTSFLDVKPDHPLSWAVRLAGDKRVIDGFNSDEFKPDEPITYEQAVKIMVSLLGYDLYAQERGGIYTGYMSVASGLGLHKNLKLGAGSTVSKGDGAILLYNAASADFLKPYIFGTNTEYVKEKGYTILEDSFGILKKTGIVTGNGITRLTGETNLPDTQVEINGVKFLLGESAASAFLGYHVTYYYKEVDGDNIIMYAAPTRQNQLLEIPAERITSYEGGVYKYTVRDDGRDITIRVPLDVNIIYNGTTAPNYTNEMLKPDAGGLTFLDANSDGNYETLFIEDISYFVVGSVDTYERIIYNKFPLDPSQKSMTADSRESGVILSIENPDGDPFPLGDLKENDVLSIRKSKGTKKQLINIIVNRSTAEGLVSEISKNDDISKYYVMVDDTKYSVTKYFDGLQKSGLVSPLKVMDSVRLLTDEKGRLVSVVSATGAIKYAYIMDIASAITSVDTRLRLKLLTEEGEQKAYFCSDRVKIDQTSPVNPRDILINPDGTAKRQVIGYTLNSKEEINLIDTMTKSGYEDDYTIRRVYPAEGSTPARIQYRNRTMSFGAVCNLKSDTVVFWVAENDKDEDSIYRTTGISALTNATTYFIEGYTITDIDNHADLLVVKNDGDTLLMDGSPLMLVNKKTSVVNSLGEPRTKLSGYYNGNEETILVNDISIPDASGKKMLDYISPGDLIRYERGKNGELNLRSTNILDNNYQYVLDADGNSGSPLLKITGNTNYNNDLYLVAGKVTACKSGYVWIDGNAPTKIALNLSGFKMFVFDSDKKEFRKGTVGDIVEDRYIFVHMLRSEPLELIIYK